MLDRDQRFSVPRYEGEAVQLIRAGLEHYKITVRDGEREEEFLPLGGITYNQDKKLMLFGHGGVGIRMSTAVADLNYPFDPRDYGSWANRFIRLPQFDEIVTSQVDNEVADIHTEDSLSGPPTVEVRLPYQHPTEKRSAALPMEEDEVLKIFTGEKGQLARFYGGGLPQEIGLVLEREFRNLRFGMVFFMHPSGQGADINGIRDDSDIKLQSVDGFRTFLQSLIEQYRNLPGEHQSYLTRLDRAFDSRKIELDSVCARELVSMAVISRLRLAAVKPAGGNSPDQELKQLFKGLDDGFLTNLFGEKQVVKDGRVTVARGMIENMLKPKAPEKPKSIQPKLSSSRGLKMMEMIGDQYLKPGHSMAVFLTELDRWAGSASTPAEFTDLESFLKNMQSRWGSGANLGEHLYEVTEGQGGRALVPATTSGVEKLGLMQVLIDLEFTLNKRRGEVMALQLEAESTPKQPVWERLKVPELQDLRRDVDESEFDQLTFSSNLVGLDAYIQILISKIPGARTGADFDDLKLLLEEIIASDYGRSLKNLQLVLDDEKGLLKKTGPGLTARVGDLAQMALKDMVARRHKVLFGNGVPGLADADIVEPEPEA